MYLYLNYVSYDLYYFPSNIDQILSISIILNIFVIYLKIDLNLKKAIYLSKSIDCVLYNGILEYYNIWFISLYNI